MPATVKSAPPATPAADPAPLSDLLETVRSLPEEAQRAVLSYARFLQHQEAARQTEAYHDAEWERLFNDPVKMANFARWADESAARYPDEPLDCSKL